MKRTTKVTAFVSGLVAVGMTGMLPGAFAADPLYQWNFDSGTGANTGTASGGTINANVGANSPTSGNFTAAGVSGLGGDRAFNVYNSEADW